MSSDHSLEQGEVVPSYSLLVNRKCLKGVNRETVLRRG